MATSDYEQVPSNYTDVGIALSGILAYGFGSVTWNLLTTGEFKPKKQSNTATAVGVVAGLAMVSSRFATVKMRGSPGVYGIGNPPNWY
jgi:ammonia channel protein AmtB